MVVGNGWLASKFSSMPSRLAPGFAPARFMLPYFLAARIIAGIGIGTLICIIQTDQAEEEFYQLKRQGEFGRGVQSETSTFEVFKTASNRKRCIIAIIMMFCNMFTGNTSTVPYIDRWGRRGFVLIRVGGCSTRLHGRQSTPVPQRHLSHSDPCQRYCGWNVCMVHWPDHHSCCRIYCSGQHRPEVPPCANHTHGRLLVLVPLAFENHISCTRSEPRNLSQSLSISQIPKALKKKRGVCIHELKAHDTFGSTDREIILVKPVLACVFKQIADRKDTADNQAKGISMACQAH